MEQPERPGSREDHAVPVLSGAASRHRGILRLQVRLAALSGLVEQVLVFAAGVLLVYLCIILFAQVVFRYFLFLPLPWSEESARFAMVWFGMLAAAVAARKGLHFVFRWGTMLVIPARVRPWLRQAVSLLILVFLGLVFFQSLKYLDVVANQTAQATGLNMRVPYAGVTAGVVAMFVIYALELMDAVCSWYTGRSFSEWERREAEVYSSLGAGGMPEGAAADPTMAAETGAAPTSSER